MCTDAVAGFKVGHVDEISQKLLAVGFGFLPKLPQYPLRELQVLHFARLVHRCPPTSAYELCAGYACMKIAVKWILHVRTAILRRRWLHESRPIRLQDSLHYLTE